MFNIFKYNKERKLIDKDVVCDENDKDLINITIKDKQEVLSPFILDNKETINVEFANLLDNTMKSIPPQKDIHLNLHCLNIKEEDKNTFSQAIKNYYFNSSLDSQRKLKNNTKTLMIMIILSIISLTALFLVNYFEVHWLICEVIDIVAWVFVWEGVDIFAFQRSITRFERRRNYALYSCEITFN